MNVLRHELISASAGSGKTYQLVRRYLHLLALGVEPETVVAMTFTRKAAGEFFGRILTRLAGLASGEEDAAGYFAGLSPAVPAGVDYGGLLRRVTRRMHRLRLGTLDSFFASIATCFPLELGLPANASVMDEAEARLMQERTLDALLDDLHDSADTEATRLFLESVKRASFGHEEKRMEEMLRLWVKENHELWTESAGAVVWGNPAVVWGADFLKAEAVTSAALSEAAAALRDVFPATTPSGREALDGLCAEVTEVQVAAPLPKTVKAFLMKTAESLAGLRRGSAEVMWYRKTVTVSGAAAAAWLRLSGLLVRRELLVRAHRTAGLAVFLEGYEERYQRQVRGQGRLSFGDIPRLIRDRAGDEDSRWPQEDLWFRLDGRFDHWMLDEFQDTSFNQWRVTHRLVDEVIQDPEGNRSFFAVGDIKQSIYVWRQAEPGLFNELKRLRPAVDGEAGGIQVSTLSKSYRSAQPVLDAVNAVFEDGAALEVLLPGATKEWEFSRHVAAKTALTGCVRLVSTTVVEKGNGEGEEETEEEEGALEANAVQRATAGLIREMDPLGRGLTCAVLVRSNKKAAEFTSVLRALTGMNVVTDSTIQPVTDNAVTLAMLSLLQLAAHPGDRLALEHLLMTPLGGVFGGTREGVMEAGVRAARAVFESGFSAFVMRLAERMGQSGVALDGFHQRRVEQLLDFAGTFDEGGSRDIDLFLEGAREYTVSQLGAGEAVQVMTVHKSKGLEFDVVILPDLNGSAMDSVRRRSWIVRRDRGDTRWVMQSPDKVYAVLDEVLMEEAKETREKTAFESLCRLYVAMTRAKRGLYFIATPPPATPKAMKEDLFLRRRLVGEGVAEELEWGGEPLLLEWQTGDAGWYESAVLTGPVRGEAAAMESEARPLGEVVKQNQATQRRVTPSGEEHFKIPGKVLFSPGRDVGRHLGSRVHEMMAEVTWWEAGMPVEPLMERWRELGWVVPGDVVSDRALELVLPMLGSEAGQEALRRPGGEVRLWREKPFDFIDSGAWVSGVFDRVVVECDADGKATAAHVLDFKTDEAADEAQLQEKAAGYAPQLALYRRAVARLTGLSEERIRTRLLFLRALRMVEVG
jgi:ATP-dependent helicase/nuclease subunit A